MLKLFRLIIQPTEDSMVIDVVQNDGSMREINDFEQNTDWCLIDVISYTSNDYSSRSYYGIFRKQS